MSKTSRAFVTATSDECGSMKHSCMAQFQFPFRQNWRRKSFLFLFLAVRTNGAERWLDSGNDFSKFFAFSDSVICWIADGGKCIFSLTVLCVFLCIRQSIISYVRVFQLSFASFYQPHRHWHISVACHNQTNNVGDDVAIRSIATLSMTMTTDWVVDRLSWCNALKLKAWRHTAYRRKQI